MEVDDLDRRVLNATESLCPLCLKKVGAFIISEGDEVFLEKSCPGHGEWKVVLWRGEPQYEHWVRPKKPVQPDVLYHEVKQGCPICFADTRPNPSIPVELDMETIGWWYERVMEAAGPCNQLSGGEPTFLTRETQEALYRGR